MTQEGLAKITEELRRIAELHDCVFVDESRPRATSYQIEALESFVGVAMPSSYRLLLEWQDGLAFRFISKGDIGRVAFPIACHELTVYGTTEFVRETENFRYFVDTTSEETYGRLQRCFEIVNCGEPDSRVVFSLDAPRKPSDYGIFVADLYEFNAERALADVNDIVIADSLDDFLIKAFDHMIKTENGFWYWLGPQRSYW